MTERTELKRAGAEAKRTGGRGHQLKERELAKGKALQR